MIAFLRLTWRMTRCWMRCLLHKVMTLYWMWSFSHRPILPHKSTKPSCLKLFTPVVHCPDMEEDILYVVVFDFPTMIASLFNCPVLGKLEKPMVNPSDRFAKYEAPNRNLER
jgi:hypothetical protein